MSDKDSAEEDSFQSGLLDSPRYTRPRDFNSLTVPDVLISGDHAAVRKWRRGMAIKKTMERRPDLLAKAQLDDADREIIESLKQQGD
jgi:tRNA (guanine37-N1)-methyltransferase